MQESSDPIVTAVFEVCQKVVLRPAGLSEHLLMIY
jgi:hypothetical protein